jgi:hypothetical protein
LEIFKNTLLYITAGSFGSGGEGKVFISASGVVGEVCDPTVIPSLRTVAMLCGDQVLVVHLAGAETVVVARCFTGLSLPHPPKPSSKTDILTELIYMICE